MKKEKVPVSPRQLKGQIEKTNRLWGSFSDYAVLVAPLVVFGAKLLNPEPGLSIETSQAIGCVVSSVLGAINEISTNGLSWSNLRQGLANGAAVGLGISMAVSLLESQTTQVNPWLEGFLTTAPSLVVTSLNLWTKKLIKQKASHARRK